MGDSSASRHILDAINFIPKSKVLRYDFQSKNPGSNYGDGIGAETFTDFSQTASDVSDPWKFFSDTSVFKYTKFLTPAYGFLLSGGGLRQFMIQVPEGAGGSYQAEWVGTLYPQATETEFRLQKCDAEGTVSGDEVILGRFLPNAGSDTLNQHSKLLAQCDLEEGYYLLSVDVLGAESYNKCILDAINFYQYNPADRSGLVLSAAEYGPISMDKESKIPVSALRADGKNMDMNGASYQVDSEDPSIAEASVEKTGEGCLITVNGVGEGETTLRLSGTYGALNGVLELPVAVIDKKLFITIPEESWAPVGEPTDIPIQVDYQDGELDASQLTSHAESSDASVADVAVQIENGKTILHVTGKKQGEVTVTVTLGYGADEDTVTGTLYVAAIQDLSYNFFCANPGSGETGAETFTDFKQSTAKGSDPWKFFSDTSVFKYTKFVTPAYGFLFSGGGPRQFMIRVPASGTYQAEWVGTIYNQSTQTQIKLQPCDQAGNTTGTETVIGDITPYHATDTLHHQKIALSQCELRAGYYILTVDLLGESSASRHILDAVNFHPQKLDMAVQAPELRTWVGMEGRSLLSASVGGEPVDLSGATFDIALSDPEGAEIGIEKGSDRVDRLVGPPAPRSAEYHRTGFESPSKCSGQYAHPGQPADSTGVQLSNGCEAPGRAGTPLTRITSFRHDDARQSGGARSRQRHDHRSVEVPRRVRINRGLR